MQRYILTDAGNVMTRFKFRADLVCEIMAGFGVVDVNPANIFQTDSVMLSNEDYYHDLDTGKFGVYDLYRCLVREHTILENVCTYPLFLSLWCRHLEPIEDVIRLYRRLQETFPLVVISNGDAEGVRHITYHLMGTHGLKFQEVFISGERGRKKPELFADVVAFLHSRQVDPFDCVFIDDLKHYVDAAYKIGIPAIQFDGSKQDVNELEIALARMGFKAE